MGEFAKSLLDVADNALGAPAVRALAHVLRGMPALRRLSLARNVRTGNKWAKIDPCIGKMTEENGD